MPGITRESWASGDQKWLASAHGIHNARSGSLTVANFTAGTHYPNGYFPSGLEVNAADEADIGPWTGAAGEELGYLLFDLPLAGDDPHLNGPILRHAMVNVEYLPIAHVEAAAVDGGSTNGFVFIAGSDA